jgi:quinol-cytochrome oxidoreductase complex cytochrome b subunit
MWITQNRLWRSVFRNPLPQDELGRMATMFTNFFLHILPARVNRYSLKLSATWALGAASAILFVLLFATGIPLMFFYAPTVERAYADMKDLEFVVSYGLILCNMHRWAAHGMVAIVFLHMVRVFYTGSYKPPREFNWVLGVWLWLLTLVASFTGYLLPWDQLAFWAITVGTSIAGFAPVIGEKIRMVLLGGTAVGQGALLRFYVLHVLVIPLLMMVLIAVHFWRVRKDGGLARPERAEGARPARARNPSPPVSTAIGFSPFPPKAAKTYALMEIAHGETPLVSSQAPEEELPAWPHLIFRLLVLFAGIVAAMAAAGYFFDAPLGELANPLRPENPAKAPWYFLGLQEMVGYSALAGGVVVPGLAILALLSIPYVDRERDGEGVWFTSRRGTWLALWSFLGSGALAPLLTFLNLRFRPRRLYPDIPQYLVDLVNPASVLTLLIIVASLLVMWVTRSRRMAAITLFSAFLAAYIVYTVIGVYLRGPNWILMMPWQTPEVY